MGSTDQNHFWPKALRVSHFDLAAHSLVYVPYAGLLDRP